VCPVCLGLPGVLPVLNEEVLTKAVIAGLATNSQIAAYSKFDRKQYFYPDLPKAYQISQYDKPICINGEIHILDDEEKKKRIRINRIHMEEDAGKLIHGEDQKGRAVSYIDLNRTGVPLLEIVSEPDLDSANEAYNYLINLKAILLYADISDGNMEEGSLRCDANVSVRLENETKLGTRCEIKNLNSFKAVKAAIQYEIHRQIDIIESGKAVVQETRLWDADQEATRLMREKDEAHDYRYFPDPDLVPIVVGAEYIDKIRKVLPELPQAKMKRFQESLGLPEYDASVLCAEKAVADYFEGVVKAGTAPKKASNWIMAEVMFILKNQDISVNDLPVTPQMLHELLKLVDDNIISGKIAKGVFEKMLQGQGKANEIVEKEGLKQLSDDSAIEKIVQEVLAENQEQVAQYRSGKTKVFGFLVGQIMKKSKGKANPEISNKFLKDVLEKD
jgi:aspartyl-tRNA(Asn)/glutamyl-tRNA(Gln) amidotransferase subunit B